jgi:hypothetical protein
MKPLAATILSFQLDSTRKQEPGTGFWVEITSYFQGRAFMLVLNSQINPILAI